MGEPYRRKRTFYQDVSGSTNVLVGTAGPVALATARNANNTIYLQKVHMEITTGSGAVTWTLQDTAGTPIPLVPSVSAAAVAHFDFDFGPEGVPCTVGTNLSLVLSG